MSTPARAPNFLDHVERVLLRIILVALALLAVLVGFAVWHAKHQTAAAPAGAPAVGAVALTIDFPDGFQKRYTGLEFKPGMTVLDAMNAARAHARPLSFGVAGAGERALLTQIDDLKNESGSPGKTRAWQYWINARYGDESIGVAKLSAGDRVIWAFRPYESDPKPPP